MGCSESRSPESTVRAFYKHLNAAEYSKAKELHSSEARQLVDGQLMALGGGFAAWGENKTKGGTLKEVRVVEASARGEGATVTYELVFKDGTSKRQTVSLTREKGSWLMGLVP